MVYKPRSVGINPAIISLGHTLPCGSSDLPEAPVTKTGKRATSRPSTCKQVGELCFCLVLLPMGVAWPSHYCERRWSLTPPFHLCQLPGSLFLWSYPEGYPSPGVARHRSLRSADFPRSRPWRNRDRPTNLGVFIIPFSRVGVNIILKEKSAAACSTTASHLNLTPIHDSLQYNCKPS